MLRIALETRARLCRRSEDCQPELTPALCSPGQPTEGNLDPGAEPSSGITTVDPEPFVCCFAIEPTSITHGHAPTFFATMVHQEGVCGHGSALHVGVADHLNQVLSVRTGTMGSSRMSSPEPSKLEISCVCSNAQHQFHSLSSTKIKQSAVPAAAAKKLVGCQPSGAKVSRTKRARSPARAGMETQYQKRLAQHNGGTEARGIGPGMSVVWADAPLLKVPPEVCGQLVRSLQCGAAHAPPGSRVVVPTFKTILFMLVVE